MLRIVSKLSSVAYLVTLVIVYCLRRKWYLAAISYLLIVSLFWRFPTLLHKRRSKLKMPQKNNSLKVYICAHRGGCREAPENTL